MMSKETEIEEYDDRVENFGFGSEKMICDFCQDDFDGMHGMEIGLQEVWSKFGGKSKQQEEAVYCRCLEVKWRREIGQLEEEEGQEVFFLSEWGSHWCI